MHTMQDIEERLRGIEERLTNAEGATARLINYYQHERGRLMQELTDLITAGTRYKAAVDARETREEAEITQLQQNALTDADKQNIVALTQQINDGAAQIEAQNAQAAQTGTAQAAGGATSGQGVGGNSGT